MRFHSHIFFDSNPDLGKLSDVTLKKARKAFAMVVEKRKDMRVHAYGMLAMKTGTRFMLHINANSPEEIQNLIRDLMHTELGKHLRISYTLFGMTKSSQYNPTRAPKEANWDLAHTYYVVYPFTKTIEWHLMPYEERRNIMWSHVQVGKKYSDKISQRLLYAYGLDDHEFIVSYYMDDLEAFVELVMEMRTTESRRHTKNDLPIFTCIHMQLSEALDLV
jgi:chlorite dismutase